MTGTNQNSSQTWHTKFDTDVVYIGIGNWCSVIMSQLKQDFVGTLKKGLRIINVFEGPKVHKIYEGTAVWTIHDDTGHPNQVKITNYLYVPSVSEWLINTQHWAQNETPTKAYATTLNGTRCVTHHDRATLLWGGGRFFYTVPLDKQNVFTLQTASGYTNFTAYCAAVGYCPFLQDDNTNYVTENFSDFTHPAATHSAATLPLHPYPHPEGEKPPSEGGTS